MNASLDNVSRLELPPPPRRFKGGPDGSVWILRLICVPYFVLGIGSFVYWLFLLLWAMFGTDTPGTVTAASMSRTSKGDTTLKYQYRVGQEMKSDSDSVSYAIYREYESEDNPWPNLVRVHYFSLGPFNHAELRESGGLWRLTSLVGLGALASNFMMWTAFYQFWLKPLRVRWLCQRGLAISGIVTGKRVVVRRGATYYISYAFSDPATGNSMQDEMLIWNKKLWDNGFAGQNITVFYSPKNLKRSTVYEFSGYRVNAAIAASNNR